MSTSDECRSPWASSRRTAQPEPPGTPPPDCPLSTSGLSRAKEMENQEKVKVGLFSQENTMLCKEWTDAWHPNLWASLWVCGTAPWPFLHWGTKQGRDQVPRSQRSCFWSWKGHVWSRLTACPGSLHSSMAVSAHPLYQAAAAWSPPLARSPWPRHPPQGFSLFKGTHTQI